MSEVKQGAHLITPLLMGSPSKAKSFGATKGPKHLFFKDIYLDVYSLIELVAQLPQVDETKLYSYGGSQGGALALVASALNQRIQQTIAIYPF